MFKGISFALPALVAAIGMLTTASAADLPEATKKALAKMKLDASIMNGLDAELKVPKAWLDGAAKEEGAIILGTWRPREFLGIKAGFDARFPTVKLQYHRAGTQARGMKVIIALKEGRAIADVTTSIADVYAQFKKMEALADLRDIPGVKNLDKSRVGAEGRWAAFKLSIRCMAYNTDLVKKADLPNKWEDLLDNPRWRGGKIGLSNHPTAWLLALWAAKGEKWGENFTRRLFTELDPQQRKEGMTASTALTIAGEFHANIPGPDRRAKIYADKGAPVGYHCPTPATFTLSQIAMLKKAPSPNSAKIFINWLLSREGQLLQYVYSASIPSHKDLQQRKFIPFADTIVGKPALVRDDELMGSDIHKKMSAMWRKYWTKPVGKGRKRGKKRKRKKDK